MLPRERRRLSIRETAKGVVGEMAGKPRSAAESAKRAKRREKLRAGHRLARHLIQSNPSGSKLLRRCAKAAYGGRHTYLEAGRRMSGYFDFLDKETSHEVRSGA